MMRIILSLALLLSASSLRSETVSDVWPRWRGPNDSGSSERGELPHVFDGDRVSWKAALPGKGCSTPIVFGGTIVITAPVEGKDAVIAFDWNGKERWRRTFGQEDVGKHRNGSGSNASPSTDGQSIFVYFKSGTLAALDFDGEVLWQTNLVERFGPTRLFWDHGTSPVLTDRHVIMVRMHEGESWLAAFDKASGELAWKVARNYETPTEGDQGYTTPLVMNHDGQQVLLIWGAEHLTMHQAVDGKLIWSCGNFNPDAEPLWPAIASPVVVDDIAIIAHGRNDRGHPRLHGIKLDGAGDVTATNRLWTRDDVGTFVPTPVVYRQKVYIVGDRGRVACLDPETGRSIWTDSFPRNRAAFYASPIVANGKLFAPREDGVVLVANVSSGQFELLSENDMHESVIGSPVPVQNRLILRGEHHLFCVSDE